MQSLAYMFSADRFQCLSLAARDCGSASGCIYSRLQPWWGISGSMYIERWVKVLLGGTQVYDVSDLDDRVRRAIYLSCTVVTKHSLPILLIGYTHS